ncbi:unnamed protein product, partial [Meganyctiphanes norvegica]
MKVVVTGGGGYVGYHVGWVLSRGGFDVVLYDLSRPDPEWEELAPKALWDALPEGFWDDAELPVGRLEYVKGNITDYDQLFEAMQGSVGVIHSASLGISGRAQLPPYDVLLDQVNIHGTRNVIDAATKAGVRAMVYTSSMNLGFGGSEIINEDENLPYYPITDYVDNYSKTKAISEMLVLMANGKYELDSPSQFPLSTAIELPPTPPPLMSSSNNPLLPATTLSQTFKKYRPPTPPNEIEQIVQIPTTKGTVPLRTASLRPGGIMGLGERTHVKRVMFTVRAGLLKASVGKKDMKVDWIMIQNIVQAHVKLLMALLYESSLPWEIMSPLHGFVRHPMWQIINNNNTLTKNKNTEQNKDEKLKNNQERENSDIFTVHNMSQTDNYMDKNTEQKKYNMIDVDKYNDAKTDNVDDHNMISYEMKDEPETKISTNMVWNKDDNVNNLPPIAAGRTFYISDESPVNNYEFFRPLIEGLGYTHPKYNVPVYPVLIVAYISLFLYRLLYRLIPSWPLVTPAEIKISSIGHYYSCKSARETFGFSPTRPNDFSLIVDYLKKHEP